MTDLKSSIREYAAFLDEVAVDHRGPLSTPDDDTITATDADSTAEVVHIDFGSGRGDGRSHRLPRITMTVAAAVIVIAGVVGIIGVVGPGDGSAPNVPATNPDSDRDDVVVDVEPQFPERDRIVAELLGWLAGDVAPDDVESILGVSNIPEPFFAETEQEFAAGRPGTIEQTTMLPDRSETVIEDAGGRHVRLTVRYDGNEATEVEIVPVGSEAGTELENGIALIDEQLRWLAGEEFTERDFVRRHSGLARDSYANFVDIAAEVQAGGPYDDVVYRGFNLDGSGIVLLRRDDGGSLMYGANIEDGRILATIIQTSRG